MAACQPAADLNRLPRAGRQAPAANAACCLTLVLPAPAHGRHTTGHPSLRNACRQPTTAVTRLASGRSAVQPEHRQHTPCTAHAAACRQYTPGGIPSHVLTTLALLPAAAFAGDTICNGGALLSGRHNISSCSCHLTLSRNEDLPVALLHFNTITTTL